MFRKRMDQVDYEMDFLELPHNLRRIVKLYYNYLYVNVSIPVCLSVPQTMLKYRNIAP